MKILNCFIHCVSRSGKERDSIHPAVLRADHLETEVGELRVLRERDKQRFELMLAEAESAKGKLLRQVRTVVVCLVFPENVSYETDILEGNRIPF